MKTSGWIHKVKARLLVLCIVPMALLLLSPQSLQDFVTERKGVILYAKKLSKYVDERNTNYEYGEELIVKNNNPVKACVYLYLDICKNCTDNLIVSKTQSRLVKPGETVSLGTVTTADYHMDWGYESKWDVDLNCKGDIRNNTRCEVDVIDTNWEFSGDHYTCTLMNCCNFPVDVYWCASLLDRTNYGEVMLDLEVGEIRKIDIYNFNDMHKISTYPVEYRGKYTMPGCP